MNALVPVSTNNAEAYRASTDAAGLCKDIVVATAMEIQDRKYVRVEGWQAIAIAHGCTGSSCEVERVPGGVRAVGQVRRMSDGAVIAEAEGFVGEDEPTWFGGTQRAWKWGEKRGEKVWYEKELPKRADYAIRAMAQTRAISRACRSAFAHVVVMMNAGLSTTPAEEVPQDGFDDDHAPPLNVTPEKAAPDRAEPAPKAKAAAPTVLPLATRAQALEATMRKTKTADELRNVWARGSGLCADLDMKDPERLAELEQLYATLFDELAIPAADEFGLAGDAIPEFA
jgi:hypothetical protein